MNKFLTAVVAIVLALSSFNAEARGFSGGGRSSFGGGFSHSSSFSSGRSSFGGGTSFSRSSSFGGSSRSYSGSSSYPRTTFSRGFSSPAQATYSRGYRGTSAPTSVARYAGSSNRTTIINNHTHYGYGGYGGYGGGNGLLTGMLIGSMLSTPYYNPGYYGGMYYGGGYSAPLNYGQQYVPAQGYPAGTGQTQVTVTKDVSGNIINTATSQVLPDNDPQQQLQTFAPTPVAPSSEDIFAAIGGLVIVILVVFGVCAVIAMMAM